MSSRSLQYGLATASGILFALSFPKYGHPALAWIALAPLLVALQQTTPWRAFALGLLTGVIYFTGTLYWITGVMARYGDLQTWVAILVNASLVAYLAFFPALFAFVVRRLTIAHGPRMLAAAPIVWVATELGRNYPFGGFPWVLLGYSQVTVLPIAQLASIFGVHGVSMLVASVSTAAAMYAASGTAKTTAGTAKTTGGTAKTTGGTAKTTGGTAKAVPYVRDATLAYVGHPFRGAYPIAIVLAIVFGVAAWGARRASSAELTRSGEAIRVGLIQGNVSLEERMDRSRLASIFDNYLNMTRQAIREGASFVIWPEAAAPFRFEDDPISAGRIRTLAQQSRVPILLGSDQIEPGAKGLPTRYYNSAFMVRAARPAARTARCTWCHSASTCRRNGCSFSPRRSWRTYRIFPPVRSQRFCRSARTT